MEIAIAAVTVVVRKTCVMKNDSMDASSSKTGKKNKRMLVILICALIAIAIAGVYLVKNREKDNIADAEETLVGNRVDVVSAEVSNSGQAGQMDEAIFALDATEDFDLDKILSYGMPVIIDFGSDSCIPCKEMAPALAALNEELRGKAIVKFVDIWKNPDAANGIPLRVIPTQFFFDAEGNPYVPNEQDTGFILYKHQETGAHVFTAHEGGMEKDDILAVLEGMGL